MDLRKASTRIKDANINRLKEGLRVTEEVCRFILNDKKLSAGVKRIRHELDALFRAMPGYPNAYLKERDSGRDVGRGLSEGELERKGTGDIFFANMQRAKESVRVLEEFSKLTNRAQALKFKNIRYRLYTIEAKIGKKL